jgi:redox-sensitive bicupin YhaK (pirin superfamily)
MRTIRKASERGTSRISWLDSRHTFSFSEYWDPAHMGFRALRVINDDRVAGGAGFPTHSHRDMEIITWVLEGGLAHKDSVGTSAVIRVGDAQRMSAGTGVQHSEFNASKTDPVRFLQIWIMPERRGVKPGYEQKSLAPEDLAGKLHVIGSRDGRDGSLTIQGDVTILAGRLAAGDSVAYDIGKGRGVWLQVARGAVTVDGQALAEGDGLKLEDEARLAITATSAAEVLVFDLA